MSHEMSDTEARVLLNEQKHRTRLLATAARRNPLGHLWYTLALCLLGLGIWA